jgi:hypothetical protein
LRTTSRCEASGIEGQSERSPSFSASLETFVAFERALVPGAPLEALQALADIVVGEQELS